MRIFYCAFLDVTPTMTEDTQIFTINLLARGNFTISQARYCAAWLKRITKFSSYPEKVQRALDGNWNDERSGSGTWQFIQAITKNLSDYS